MSVEQSATHAPIHAKRGPITSVKAPIGPRRVAFPIANSHSRSGTDQLIRKIAHGIKNEPPPLVAAMRGKRQMFPVPTAMLNMANSIVQRLAKRAPS
jgi:hypothetical protein